MIPFLKKLKEVRRPRCAALVAAAGSSSRMGGVNKLLLPLDGVPVLVRTLEALQRAEGVDEEGFQYPLHDAVLTPEFPVGVSNHILEPRARVSVRRGALIVGWELPPLCPEG